MNTNPPSVHVRSPDKPRTTRRMVWMLIGCALLFGGVFGWKAFMGVMMGKYFDNMPVPPAAITTGKVQTMLWDTRLEAVGSLAAVNGADMTTESGGIVTAIHFESGSNVAEGARLVTLDSAAEEGTLKQLQAQARLAELNRQRREKLWKLDAISKSDYDAAVSEANAAKAAVAAQGGILGQKEIRAPFSGELGIRRVNIGQYLAPGTPIVSLTQLDPIFVDFSLPEQQVALVQAGQSVDVGVEAIPDKTFTGKVIAVEPAIDEATRNFRVRAQLANPKRRLRPGQFVRVTLALPGEREVLVVPRTAISYSSYGSAVFAVQPKAPVEGETPAEPQPGQPPAATLEVVQRFVKLGETRGDFVAVTEGLKAGDEVATSGLLKLRNQQPVTIDTQNVPKPELNPSPEEG